MNFIVVTVSVHGSVLFDTRTVLHDQAPETFHLCTAESAPHFRLPPRPGNHPTLFL